MDPSHNNQAGTGKAPKTGIVKTKRKADLQIYQRADSVCRGRGTRDNP
jgi:hypothetical protein